MEHSALHALSLCGIVITLGGTFFTLAIFFPAANGVPGGVMVGNGLNCGLQQSLARWIFLGALFGAGAGFLNLFVDVAEVRNQTIFAGVSLAEVWRFATVTTVGQLTIARIGALLLVAVVAADVRRRMNRAETPNRLLTAAATWWLAGIFAVAAVVLNSFVCHAAAQPAGRTAAVFWQIAHTAAASIWLGGLIHLLLARKWIESATTASDADLLGQIVKRFSPIALTVVGLIFLSGIVAAVRYLVSPAAVPTSAYGLTLVVKLLLMIPLLYAGWMNFRVIQPALLALNGAPASGPARSSNPAMNTPGRRPALQRFSKMLELEVTMGVLVITVAGILASIPPPGDSNALRLTVQQTRALLSPDLPTTAIVNPAQFVGAAARTVDDLRYSEFTHNWSGVFVCVMGLCWLGQSLRGRAGGWAERLWPFALIPFAIFIAIAADPEVWILRTMSLGEGFANPAVAEHQIGALLVLILVWLGWRDKNKPAATRPLGYALPVLMIGGSLLLLGHAHSALTATQELTNLVNVQHAVLGTFGLFAGTVRWLDLRGLFPERLARVVWPGLVVALGLFMAFFYRELV